MSSLMEKAYGHLDDAAAKIPDTSVQNKCEEQVGRQAKGSSIYRLLVSH